MKTPTIFLFGALFAIACFCFAGAPPFKPGHRAVEPPVGLLGYRIGTYLTVEGVSKELDKGAGHTLLVDKIGDYILDRPVGIGVENVRMTSDQRCVLKGYETGGWVGVPDEVLRATGAPPPQAAWQFRFYFRATSIESPKKLKIDP